MPLSYSPYGLAFSPRSIAAGPDGRLWVGVSLPSLFAIPHVVAYRPSTFAETDYPVGSAGSMSGGMFGAISDGSNLWFTVTNLGASQNGVVEVSPTGVVGTVAGYTPPPGNPPGRMAYGPDGNFWICTDNVGTIVRCTPGGTFSHFTAVGSSFTPESICSDGADLWVTGSFGLYKVATAGTGTLMNSLSGLSSPQGVCFGPDGNIWVASALNPTSFQVVKLNLAGTILATYTISTPGSLTTGFIPTAIGTDGTDMWVCGFNFGIFSSEGSSVYRVSMSGASTYFPLGGSFTNTEPTMITHLPGSGWWAGMWMADPGEGFIWGPTAPTAPLNIPLRQRQRNDGLTSGASRVKSGQNKPTSSQIGGRVRGSNAYARSRELVSVGR